MTNTLVSCHFGDDGVMAVGWTDLEVGGKVMHYYFRPSGNMARGSWADIDGSKCYFRDSGNMATGWVDIDGKKYWFDESGQMVTGWREIDNGAGVTNRYYFRPSGSMATGWATIDGQNYWLRPSGNMATGWADVDDAYKRYFDGQGRMLTGWQEIGGKTYYFRASVCFLFPSLMVTPFRQEPMATRKMVRESMGAGREQVPYRPHAVSFACKTTCNTVAIQISTQPFLTMDCVVNPKESWC